MLFGVVVAAQLFQGVLGDRVFDDADCEQLVTSRFWSLDEPCMLERNFDLSDLSTKLPNDTYSTKYVYVKDVPRIDECVHALFIVPEMSGQSEASVTISNAHFVVDFTPDNTGGYGKCDEISVTLFLGNVNLNEVKIEYYLDELITDNEAKKNIPITPYSCMPSTSDNP